MTDKITFTSNGESHELSIDGSKTLRPGNVSPDMKLTATGSFNSLSKIVFNSGAEPIMTIHPDGRITLGENAQPTEAAAACIEAMSDMIQDMIKNAVSRQSTQSDALVAALVEASEGLKQDLLNRAEWDDDAKVVCAGAGAWPRFTTALAALQEQSK